MFQDGPGEDAHEADRAAAIDETDVAGGHIAAQGFGGGGVLRARAGVGATIDADAFNSAMESSS
jgi:hypothetical protein